MLRKLACTNSIKEFIIAWDNLFPFDFIYRRKNNILFDSPQHRQLSLISIKSQFIEDEMVAEYRRQEDMKENLDNDLEFLNTLADEKKMSDKEVDFLFDNLDIEALNNETPQSEEPKNDK